MLPPRLAARLARRLHTAWATRAGAPPDPAPGWRNLTRFLAAAYRTRRRVRLAAAAHLTLTGPGLRADLAARLDRVARQAELLRAEYAREPAAGPDLAAWVAELRHLEAEFAAVAVRWRDRVLRAVTDPVTLRGVDLGRFAIELDWARVGDATGARCFEVVAVDPNPAAGRDEVTHPHVHDGVLCAGDAAVPLAAALDAGRLADAFLIVRAVLTTYNPHSPYVPLAEWGGVVCADCGRRTDRDEASACERCDAVLCDDCAGSCAACSRTRCADCLGRCDVCSDSHCKETLEVSATGRDVCPGCWATCPGCQARVPEDELSGDPNLCPACAAEEDPDDEVVEGAEEPAPDVPATP